MNTEQHVWHKRFGRLQISLTLWIHHYARESDRWVFAPTVIYDRKGVKT